MLSFISHKKIYGFEKNVSSLELCRACYADYFGEKDSELNQQMTVLWLKILKNTK
jgi:hypothetical protein